MSSNMEEDGEDKDDTKRRTRNLSEKKRRDQFNTLVNELSALISSTNRKMDKSTVLKSTISFLKNHNEVTVKSRAHDVGEDWKPAFLSNEEFTYLLLEALEGFIMVFSATGRIYYVSESITSLLGHNPADVLNQTIFDLTYEEDRPNLYNLLQNPSEADYLRDPTTSTENEIRFRCHFHRRILDFRDEAAFELIQFNGHFLMLSGNQVETADDEELPSYQPENEMRSALFVCTGRLYTPQLIRDVSLIDPARSEFTSRHSLEWKFLFLDHRAPPIIGYLPFEVLGTSGYDYYHFDDLEKIITCHEALMHKGELTSCFYRFLTKGQQWIWLQTRFYITYHQWNSKPEFVVCSHRVVSFSDVAKTSKPEASGSDVRNQREQHSQLVMDTPSEDGMVTMSPSYMSEASDAFNSYQNVSHPPSVKSASAGSTAGTVATSGAGASWSRRGRFYAESDTGSISGESRSSQRNNTRELAQVELNDNRYHQRCHGAIMMVPQGHRPAGAALVPQHGMGAQYLDPAPYVGALGVPGVIQLPPLPVIVSPDQAQIQLQRKHEELQEMIVRQQEELRHVKEQLLLARLGMLQPIINVPNAYLNPEDMGQNQRVHAQISYEDPNQHQRNNPGYPSAQPPHSNDHQNMPQ